LLSANPTYETFPDYSFGSNSIIEPVFGTSGKHKINGIVIIKSPAVKKKCELQGSSVVDITPTILYIMGIPLPEQLDGQVLVEAFEPDYLEHNSIQYEKNRTLESMNKYDIDAYTNEEKKEIRRRLKDLGYLGQS
jgi:hypothetical protein